MQRRLVHLAFGVYICPGRNQDTNRLEIIAPCHDMQRRVAVITDGVKCDGSLSEICWKKYARTFLKHLLE